MVLFLFLRLFFLVSICIKCLSFHYSQVVRNQFSLRAQNAPMKLLYVVEPSPFSYISGYKNRFQELFRCLNNMGDSVEILSPEESPLQEKKFLNFPVHGLSGFPLPMYRDVKITSLSLSNFRIIENVIKSFQPTLIHITVPSLCVLPSVKAALRNQIPVVLSYHTDILKYADSYLPFPGICKNILKNLYLKPLFHSSNLNLVTSPQLQENLCRLGVCNAQVWQKGINTQIFSPDHFNFESRRYLTGGYPHDKLLLYVGRLGKEKGLDRLKYVMEMNSDARLAIIGDGPDRSRLEDIFGDYKVRFFGEMTGIELSRAYASADLFVMPSNSETLGFVVIESLASGVPVVGVSAGGLIDLIDSGRTGYLVDDNDDMKEFSVRVSQLLGNDTRRKEFSANAVAWAEQWSWEKATENLRNIQYPLAIENWKRKER